VALRVLPNAKADQTRVGETLAWIPAVMCACLYIQLVFLAEPLNEQSLAYQLSEPVRSIIGDRLTFWSLLIGHNILTLVIAFLSWTLFTRRSRRVCFIIGTALLASNIVVFILWLRSYQGLLQPLFTG
jgi:hypothetical protein